MKAHDLHVGAIKNWPFPDPFEKIGCGKKATVGASWKKWKKNSWALKSRASTMPPYHHWPLLPSFSSDYSLRPPSPRNEPPSCASKSTWHASNQKLSLAIFATPFCYYKIQVSLAYIKVHRLPLDYCTYLVFYIFILIYLHFESQI